MAWWKWLLLSLGALLLLGGGTAGFLLWQLSGASGDPAFFEDAIVAFEEADREAPPAKGGIVFVGSSSIRMWKSLSADMAPLPVLNRGFGGAHMEHVVHNARRVVTPYAPRAVVVYVGTNDLGAGKSTEQVAADFRRFLEIVHADLPEADVWLLSMKPSPLRWSGWPVQQELDGRLRALAEADPRVRFVETGATLLGPDGTPDGDLYRVDSLHLNGEGYRRWTALLKPLLLEAYGSR